MTKLDLLNSRLELPKRNCVYDSVEDVNLASSSLSRTCMVNLGSKATKSRKMKLNSIKVPDRLDIPIVTSNGDYIDVTLRTGSLVNYGRSKSFITHISSDEELTRSNFTEKASKGGVETMSISNFKELVREAISNPQMDSKPNKRIDDKIRFETPVLDFIKDRIHEDISHTIQFQIQKKRIPAPDIAHNRPTALSSNIPAAPGPGDYTPIQIATPHAPQTFINPPRVTMDETKGEIVPLKERLRKERQQKSMESLLAQYKKKTESVSGSKHYKSNSNKLNPPKLLMRSSLTGDDHPLSFGTSSPRFVGPVYHTESYVKTSGMILGPDYEKKMEERYQLGPKFTKGPARVADTKREVVFDPPDVMRFLSMTAEAERSPIKYSAAFRPPSPKMSLKDRLRRSQSPYRTQNRSNSADGGINFGASQTISGTLDDFGNIVKVSSAPADSNKFDEDDNAILGDGSHLGPGAFFPNCAPPSIEIHNPSKPSISFIPTGRSRSRLAHEKEAVEKAKLAAIEEERIRIDSELHEQRLQRERLRSFSILPLIRKRK